MDLNEAKIKRRSIKASATRLRNFIDTAQASQVTNFELIERKRKLANLFEQYEEVQTRIEYLESGGDEGSEIWRSQSEERTRFEEAYFQLMALYEQRLSRFEHTHTHVTGQSSNVTYNQGIPPGNSESQIRLPKIQLPSFSGKYEDWYTFHDSFDKLIHTNENLSAIQKFHYLRSSLKEGAAEVIKSFDITADNYIEAWQLLNERFDNKRRIVQTHIKAMFEIAPIHKENCIALRNLLDNMLKHFRALKALQRPVDTWDDMMIHLMLTKLDSVTVKEWETSRLDTNMPTFKQITEFLSKRCQALEAVSNKLTGTQSNFGASSNSQRPKSHSSHVTTSNLCCIHCKKSHFIFQCESFRKLPVEARFKVVKDAHLCINCLKSKSHQSSDCPSGSCRKCGKRHNTLLHFDSVKSNEPKNNQQSFAPSSSTASLESPLPVVTQCTQISSASKIFLSTAVVNVYDCKGEVHNCRVLLDSGSQLNFITETLANKLKLKGRAIQMSISGVAKGTFESKRVINVSLRSRVNAYVDNIDCVVLPKITQRLPQEFLPISEFKLPSNIVLADPNFNIPADIDLLIGAQLFWQLICVGQIKACEAHPTLQKTKLGWIISGIAHNLSGQNVATACHVTAINELDKSIARFWEIEHNISYNDNTHLSTDDQICETHFQQNTRRDVTGRFIVKLPIHNEKIQELGDSREIAKRRYFNLEKRLLTQPDRSSEYQNFMQDYINLGHMREVKKKEEPELVYYLPHHAVLKEDSTTTKLRVVFDASCKTISGLSLNDALLVGPTIQEDLVSILMRFRTFQFAMTADITKMYRQILIDDSQRCLQRIFWREGPQHILKTFELMTLTYGTAPASFLAIRTIRKLAEEEMNSLPLGAKTVLRDFYVDDMLTGASTLEEALEIKRQTIKLLEGGGFELRKWSSNNSSLRDVEGPDKREFNLTTDLHNETKALGIIWNCRSDVFKFPSVGQYSFVEKPTKRSILSRIALIFDPLGLLGPCIIIAKIIMQKLWRERVDWDESISSELHTLWKEYESKLQIISNIEVPRKVIVSGEVQDIEIHGFSDASEQAYAACVYIRSISTQGEPESYLLCSKSRVAPLKTLSIPRLELCGALLLAQLIQKVKNCLSCKVNSVYLWTDSRIVLCWLQSCSRQWTTFVANRVAEIQQITNINNWRHVPGQENPADLLSRGIMPDLLPKLNMWWFGPSWLRLSEYDWPTQNFSTLNIELPEGKSVNLVAAAQIETQNSIMNRFSKFSRLIRTIAFCFRFIKNCKMKRINNSILDSKSGRIIQPLVIKELEQSELALVKIIQREGFQAELRSLKDTDHVHKSSRILRLNPFVDSCGILRVGGRLSNANVPYNYKHPILLPGKHIFTRLLIIYEHKRHLHSGEQATLAAVCQRYWPLAARTIVRQLIKKCVICVRNSPKLSTTLMADLPKARVNIAKYAFENCGVDYAGPFWYKEGQRKNSKTVKCYIALFVCLSTKAVHIELASDLSSETFLNVFKRFISRRGRPTNMYSDNGLNFVGAERELNELFNEESVKQRITEFMNGEKIKWKFIPPRAPHMGGLWEAAIKVAKFHLKRIMGTASLRYDELFTFLVQIEAILNSRPLTPLSNDPNDLYVLTPGHFLIGCPITTYPERCVESLPSNRLSRWQRVEQLKQHFWRRWVKEYLHNCQARSKWHLNNSPIQVGQMVIVQEDNLPPLCWSLARVDEIFPGDDGIVRVVTVRTAKSTYKRPVSRLCILPCEQ